MEARAGWGRAGRGREPPATGAALASAAPAASLPDRSPGRYVLVAPFHRLGKERSRKEKKREGSQCAEPEPTGLNTGERKTPAATHVLTRAGRSRVRGQPGWPYLWAAPTCQFQNLTLQLSSGKVVPTSHKQMTSNKRVTLGKVLTL